MRYWSLSFAFYGVAIAAAATSTATRPADPRRPVLHRRGARRRGKGGVRRRARQRRDHRPHPVKQVALLEGAGYVGVEKGRVGRQPRTWLLLTDAGREAYTRHLAALRRIAGLSE